MFCQNLYFRLELENKIIFLLTHPKDIRYVYELFPLFVIFTQQSHFYLSFYKGKVDYNDHGYNGYNEQIKVVLMVPNYHFSTKTFTVITNNEYNEYILMVPIVFVKIEYDYISSSLFLNEFEEPSNVYNLSLP